jgi:diguanylate cyclase (GGDEF)-like protein
LPGRDVGDAILNIVARRLAHSLRAQDRVCHLDGDKFACMLDAQMDRGQLGRVACRIFYAVAVPLRAGAVTLSVLPSVGIATGPADGDTGELLLRHADAVMGRAQRRQQGYVLFDPCSDL